jgi:hypothetical protein
MAKGMQSRKKTHQFRKNEYKQRVIPKQVQEQYPQRKAKTKYSESHSGTKNGDSNIAYLKVEYLR